MVLTAFCLGSKVVSYGFSGISHSFFYGFYDVSDSAFI